MKDEQKEERERVVFSAFLASAGWPNDPSLFESRKPKEPDILYKHPSDGPIAFELTEFCSEDLARLSKSSEEFYVRTSSPVERIFSKKMTNTYQTSHPLELLCYTRANTVTPDDCIIAEMKHVLEKYNCEFRRVWLLGDNLHLVKN